MSTKLELYNALLRLHQVKDDLNEWCVECGFQPAAHHRLLNAKLMAAARGEIKKLMVMMPPGSAKSTYTSVCFIPWFLAQQPNRSILACSHSYTLAETFGYRARQLVNTYGKKLLGLDLRPDSRAAGEWETTNGGRYFCAGVGASIAGHRAHLGLIDDPVGSVEKADSKLERDKAWDWYNFDFLTRLIPAAPQVFVYTPWHEDDLGHRILARESVDWTVIRLPFYAEENDALGRTPGAILWPGWFLDSQFPALPRVANALYQLRPSPESGNFFEKEWLVTYNSTAELPPDLTNYVGSDHSLSKDEENDPNCFIPAGLDSRGDLWVYPDVWWKRGGTAEQADAFFALLERRHPVEWFAGKDHIVVAMKPFLQLRMVEEGVYAAIKEMPTGNRKKRERASPIAGRMAMRKVHFPAFASWWPQALHELLTFDNGVHDDFVDALACLGQGLSRMFKPNSPASPRASFRDAPTHWRPTAQWLIDSDKAVRRDELVALLDH